MNMYRIVVAVLAVTLATTQAKAMEVDPAILRKEMLKAVASGDADRISWLRGGPSKATVYVHDDENTPLLHLAVRKGNSSVMKALVEDVEWEKVVVDDVQDWRGRTLLHIAALKGHEDVAAVLLDHGASPNAKDNSNETPLHQAAYEGHCNVVGLLLKKGTDIDAESIDSETALNQARHPRGSSAFA